MSTDAHKIRLVMELRREGIADTRVLSAIEKTPRELFVSEAFRDQAYRNTALPIGEGQTISQPLVVAYMTQVLDVGDRMKVLEIGTGSGYQAAILARLCRRVYTIERHRKLLDEAEERFHALKLSNVTARCGDGTKGWPELAPWERIIVTAAADEVPEALLAQLAVGGVLVIPVGGEGLEQSVLRIVRTETGFEREKLLPVRFVPLIPGLPDRNPRSRPTGD